MWWQFIEQTSCARRWRSAEIFLLKPYQFPHQEINLALLANDHFVELIERVLGQCRLDLQIGQATVD